MPTPNRKYRNLHHWHRQLGLLAALFAIILTFTGILLNHTTELALDQRYVADNWLTAGYGLQAPQPVTYQTEEHWITQVGKRLYLDSREVATGSTPLLGAVNYQGMETILTEEALWLFDGLGELIERLELATALPLTPKGLGISQKGALAILTDQGWQSTGEALFPWSVTKQSVNMAIPGELPQAIQQQINRAYKGKGATYERLLLDLHTGRIWGPYGVYLMDLVALILAGLAITGVITWVRRW